ncbi:trehalose-phosphatase [Halorarum salinum]|uniref:Trehalose 6-phosphate phosphatase n=1 Tax=Halorarum salinum TaxID=2743089 RepID=A0A7D5QGN4_9EURY|nr:trehalose-phosphatase [Halobaculum salinum]QLG64201.1 trehalose-phosphatase [Halobaculum salinum]
MSGESDRDPPPLLEEPFPALRDRVAGAPGLLVCLDFDGTLAPIVEDPAAAELSSGARDALVRLVDRPSVEVAVVSGRSLADLRERVDVPGVHLAGNHGLELDVVGGEECEAGGEEAGAADRTGAVDPEVEGIRPAVAAAVTELRSELADVPGSLVEDKGLTASVHYRRTPEEHVGTVEEAVTAAVAAADGLRLTRGKRVFELRPDVEGGKDRAVRLLRDRHPAYRTLFVGDDVTDEDAFDELRPTGVAVLVGDRADTAASVRVHDPEAVVRLLRWLAGVPVGGDEGAASG